MNEWKKILASEIEAGKKVKEVREVIKTYKTQKQDMYDETAEIFKPSIEVQKEVKKTIDEKQDKIIEQLQENQKALTDEIGNIVEANQRAIMFEEELPEAIEGPSESGIKPLTLDIDNNFTKTDRTILNNYKLVKTKDLTQIPMLKLLEGKQKSADLAKKNWRQKIT